MKTLTKPLLGTLILGLSASAFADNDQAKAISKEKSLSDYFEYSGKIAYRYDYYNDSGNDYKRQRYRIGLNGAFKPTDNLSLNARVIGGDGTRSYTSARHYNYTNRGYSNSSLKFGLSNLYVKYTGLPNTEIRVGKVPMRSPWTVGQGTIGGENVGEGVIVDYKFDVINTKIETQAAFFNNQNFDASGSSLKGLTKNNGEITDGDENVIYGLVKAKLPHDITLDAGYIDVQDTLDSYTVGAMAKYDVDDWKFRVDARHTNLSFDGSDVDNTLTKFGVGAEYGIWGGKVAYGFTGDEGGFVAIDSDSTGWYQGAFESVAFNLNKKTDTSLLKTGVYVNVTPKVKLSYDYNKYRNHASGEKDYSWSARVTYKHNKNLDGYFRYDYVGRQSEQGKRARLQLRYKF